jgi:hypothetical protein
MIGFELRTCPQSHIKSKIPSLDRKATAEGRQHYTAVGRNAAGSMPKRALRVAM